LRGGVVRGKKGNRGPYATKKLARRGAKKNPPPKVRGGEKRHLLRRDMKEQLNIFSFGPKPR